MTHHSLALRSAIKKYVTGKQVVDLGAGDLAWSRWLLASGGAARVIAVDKEPAKGLTKPPRRAEFHYCQMPFACYADDIAPYRPFTDAVAFVSWPVNNTGYMADLLRVIESFGTVVYIGSNTDGTACGTPELFNVLCRRQLLDYVPGRLESLIVVGEPLEHLRLPTGEEWAGRSSVLYRWDEVRDFDEAAKAAA